MDEFLWGAAWLRRATHDENFLNYIQSNGKTLGAEENINEFGWENKHVGLNVLVSKEVLDGNVESLESYKTSVESFLCILIPETSSSHIEYTPAGLIYRPGATVGGPGEDDVYGDDRADFRKSEPTTYINAPLLRLRKTKKGIQRLRQDLHALRFIKLMNAIDPEF